MSTHDDHTNQRAAASDEPSATPRHLGLAELAEAAGVSIRTVRYYITEGLLPPPHGAGPRSAYDAGHLDRLRLIGRLKAAYLPLREIRRRLTGLDDAAVRALLARLDAAAPPTAPLPDSAADYLRRVMRPAAPAPPLAAPLAAPPAPLPAASPPGGREARRPEAYHPRDAPPTEEDAVDALHLPAAAIPAVGLDPALALVPPRETDDPAPDGAPWRRIRLGPDAELLIREEAYQRRRDQIAWLIRWARSVFG